MQQIGQLFQTALAPSIKAKAATNKQTWVPEYARFKLMFVYRDGTTSIPYHSYDIQRSKGAVNKTDEAVGYAKLVTLINARRDRYVVATVFANLTDDLRTYINGKLNMNYDHIVLKHVRGQNPWTSPAMKFRDGKLDVELFKRELLK